MPIRISSLTKRLADNGARPHQAKEARIPSWYGLGFHGKRTASGERFDMNDLTAAHRTLPFGTRVRVRNTQNGREVVVRINDRGPQISDRIIDLSKAAAAALDLFQDGIAPVVLVEDGAPLNRWQSRTRM